MKLVRYDYENILCLVQQEVLAFNQEKSTSISKENYERIINMIHYINRHGSTYQNGIFNLLQMQNKCKIIYQRICHMDLQKYNEQLEDVLCRQLPRIFDTWKNRISWFEMDENLDYPLQDGLPLYHDMYGLQGVDLVLYYLERLKKELEFVYVYKEELDEFFECLDEYTKSFWNMYNLVSNQLYANKILKNRESILLSYRDYLVFQKRNVKQIQVFYQKEKKVKNIIQLTDSYSNIDFNRLLEYLKNLALDEKIKCILHDNLSIHDVLDLLDHGIFFEEEHIYFFKQLDLYTLAFLNKYCESEWGKYLEELSDYEQITELSNQVSLH